jgi:hypothetical protein
MKKFTQKQMWKFLLDYYEADSRDRARLLSEALGTYHCDDIAYMCIILEYFVIYRKITERIEQRMKKKIAKTLGMSNYKDGAYISKNFGYDDNARIKFIKEQL